MAFWFLLPLALSGIFAEEPVKAQTGPPGRAAGAGPDVCIYGGTAAGVIARLTMLNR